jgi:hypothetical protein
MIEMNRTATTPPIAPSFGLSPADKAAQIAASHVRQSRGGWFPVKQAGDSDPDMDEALRRVTTELAYIEYADQYRTEVRAYLGSAA